MSLLISALLKEGARERSTSHACAAESPCVNDSLQ